MSCITSNKSMSAEDAQNAEADASGVSFYVAVGTTDITLTFTGCSSISVAPTPNTPPATTSVTFKTDDIGTEFEIDFQFAREQAAEDRIPIVTPSVKPKFKPVSTCP